jgi:hypothetical protein
VTTGDPPINRRLFAVCLLVGGCFMAFGVYSLLRRAIVPREFLIWFGGGILVHDLVVAPAVFAIGFGVRRLLPGWARAPVQSGLIATALLAVFTLPSFGVRNNVANPSRLPNAYGRNLAVLVIVVWLAVLGGLVLAARNRRA